MKTKFDLTKFAGAKWVGLVAASLAAFTAFNTEVENQKKERTIKDLVDRVTKLENK